MAALGSGFRFSQNEMESSLSCLRTLSESHIGAAKATSLHEREAERVRLGALNKQPSASHSLNANRVQTEVHTIDLQTAKELCFVSGPSHYRLHGSQIEDLLEWLIFNAEEVDAASEGSTAEFISDDEDHDAEKLFYDPNRARGGMLR